MKKKNILLLINQLHGGGAQKVIANLSIYLSEYYNVSLVIFNDTDKVVFPYKGELIRIKLPYAADTHNNSFYRRTVRFFSLVRQLRKIKKERQIDISISFMEASNIINILSRRKEKVILSVRTYLSHELNDHPRLNVFRIFIRNLYNRAQHIAVPALLVKTDLINNFKVNEKKVSLIYNFTDEAFVEKEKQQPLPEHLDSLFKQFPIIINVGRITNPKAQWLLIEVLAKVKINIPEAKLIILGEGPLTGKILETAANKGLRVYRAGITPVENLHSQYDVYLLGFENNPFPYLNKSHLFIMSSVYEGFPNVLIEAMSCGLPVISSDCASGPREILSPSTDIHSTTSEVEYAEYGILTPVAELNDISREEYAHKTSEAVSNILLDNEKRNHYKNQSLKRVKDFERKIIITQWINLIESGN